MTTRAGLRATIRAELNDGGVPQLWPDLQLNEWILHAIRDYGRHVPRETTASIASVAEQADYALPADCQRVARVEHPTGFFRVPDPLSAGDVLAQGLGTGGWGLGAVATQLACEVWGSFGARVLSLRPAPADASSAILVRYLATWAEPSSDSSVLSMPAQDDHLLVWYVAEAALQWLSTDESKRQRFERQRGVSTTAAAGQYSRDLRREYERRERRATPRRLVVRE